MSFERVEESPKETSGIPEEIREPVEHLEIAIELMLEDLRENIHAGAYAVIIGDDSSARIPTYIVNRVFQKIYGDKGFPAPLVRYVAGSRNLHTTHAQSKIDKLEQYTNRIQSDIQKRNNGEGRVLIITEYINSGKSLDYLIDALKKAGAPVDLATVGLGDTDIETLESKWGGKVVYGGPETQEVYGRHDLAGVEKKQGDLHATPHQNQKETQSHTNQARAVGREVADRIFENYMKGPKESA